jgi:hypothetical protein
MSTVPHWSGREVKALREARRMSVRAFAAHLGVSDRMVSKWESGGDVIRPRPLNQAALDTSLKMANPEARARFEQSAAGRTLNIGTASVASGVRHLMRHPVDGKLMTLVEAGPFTPVGAVGGPIWLPGFYIDVYPTSCAEYVRFVAATGHRPPAQWPGGEYQTALADTPVHVSWPDAQMYAAWASKSMPQLMQWQRASVGDEGMVNGHLAEWCLLTNGPSRRETRTGLGNWSGFRCVVSAEEMVTLLAI